jgi:hypothetical protein
VTLMNFFCMAGVGAFQAATGRIVAAAAAPVEGYAAVFGLYAAASFAALAVYVFSRDTRG